MRPQFLAGSREAQARTLITAAKKQAIAVLRVHLYKIHKTKQPICFVYLFLFEMLLVGLCKCLLVYNFLLIMKHYVTYFYLPWISTFPLVKECNVPNLWHRPGEGIAAELPDKMIPSWRDPWRSARPLCAVGGGALLRCTSYCRSVASVPFPCTNITVLFRLLQ